MTTEPRFDGPKDAVVSYPSGRKDRTSRAPPAEGNGAVAEPLYLLLAAGWEGLRLAAMSLNYAHDARGQSATPGRATPWTPLMPNGLGLLQEAGGKNTSARTSMLSLGGASGVSGFSNEVWNESRARPSRALS
jgi:hypothetical protein